MNGSKLLALARIPDQQEAAQAFFGSRRVSLAAGLTNAIEFRAPPLHPFVGRDKLNPLREGSCEKIEGAPGTCPPSNEGGLQGWKCAPSLDSTVANPLKSPLGKGGTWSLDVFLANSNESTGFAHRNKRFVPRRTEMSTKRLFHYKQEMRAFDW